jgi:hypothetical protein
VYTVESSRSGKNGRPGQPAQDREEEREDEDEHLRDEEELDVRLERVGDVGSDSRNSGQ